MCFNSITQGVFEVLGNILATILMRRNLNVETVEREVRDQSRLLAELAWADHLVLRNA